ncbi:MAG: hypothetical protein ACXW3J_07750 [Methylocystis sp.]
MTTAPTVGFRAELSCSALSRCLLSFWSRSRRPRSWVSSARCSEGFASGFIGAITAAIIVRGPTTRVIADAYMSRTVAVMAAVAEAEGTAAAAGVAADNSAKADFNAGRVAA